MDIGIWGFGDLRIQGFRDLNLQNIQKLQNLQIIKKKIITKNKMKNFRKILAHLCADVQACYLYNIAPHLLINCYSTFILHQKSKIYILLASSRALLIHSQHLPWPFHRSSTWLLRKYWHLLTSTDIYWNLLTFTEIYWHLLTSTDIYWHLLTST